MKSKLEKFLLNALEEECKKQEKNFVPPTQDQMYDMILTALVYAIRNMSKNGDIVVPHITDTPESILLFNVLETYCIYFPCRVYVSEVQAKSTPWYNRKNGNFKRLTAEKLSKKISKLPLFYSDYENVEIKEGARTYYPLADLNEETINNIVNAFYKTNGGK